MQSPAKRRVFGSPVWCLLVVALGAVTATAQQPPRQELFGPAGAPPSPSPGPGVAPHAAAITPREAQLEDRIRQLETMVNKLTDQVGKLGPAPATAPATGGDATAGPAGPGAAGATSAGNPAGFTGAGGTGEGAGRNPGSGDVGSRASDATPSASGGPGAPGQSFPPNPAPNARFDSPTPLQNVPAGTKFGPGFEIRSTDDEYFLQFHNLTQYDYRGYTQGGQDPVHDTFAFPRQWFMFSGRITKPWGYFVSLANGIDNISILDVFIDVNYDPRFQLRMGRYKTPFTYEFLVEPIQGLIVFERSLFFNNFGLNRDNGIMAYGRLFDGRLDYAAAIQNGTRNGFVDANDAKDVAAFLNYKPFSGEENTLFENLNVGGSVMAGREQNVPIPTVLRTAIATTGNQVIGVPFLTFNNNIRESGPRTLWDLHCAYFYNHLALIGEWGSGFQDYAPTDNLRNRTRLPINSFYVQAGYFLTGETRSSVGIVKPLRPFDLRAATFGLGALELTARYNYLQIGSDVFTRGLADPNLWANRVNMVDVGFNWHLTQYLKFYFDWEHAAFNNPVLFAPGRRQLTSDLFLARLQLYF